MVATCRRFGVKQRIEDRFLGRLDCGHEQRRHVVVADNGNVLQRITGLVRDPRILVGGERDRVIAAAVRLDAAGFAEPQDRPLREPFQVARVQRRIRRHHDHAGAIRRIVQLVAQIILVQQFADRHAINVEHAAEVRLHQHAHGVAPERTRQFARSGADAALESERDRAGAGAHVALRDRAGFRRTNRVQHVPFGDVAAADVIQPAVVGFADDWVHGKHVGVRGKGKGVIDQRVGRGRHAERVGQHDRRFDIAQLRDLRGAGQLAEAVADVHGGRNLVLEDVARVGQDGRHTGAYVVAFDQALLPDQHARHVGDRIPLARLQHTDPDAVVAQVRVSGIRGQAGQHQDGDGGETRGHG